MDSRQIIRFVGDTPVITISDDDADEEPVAVHRTSFTPSRWRGWFWRCRCGARGSFRTHDAMMAAVADHLRDADSGGEPAAAAG